MSVKWFESLSKRPSETEQPSFKESGGHFSYWESILNHVSGHSGNHVHAVLLSSIPEGQIDKGDRKV